MHWRKVSIIGLGLLGGSLGLALKQRSLAARVEGYARRDATTAEALQIGAVDAASTNLAQVVTGADLIVLCTPLCQMLDLARQMLPHLSPDAIVTDVGSVKGELVGQLQPIFASRGIDFVGSHPMAGSEKKGVTAARSDLFEKAVCVITATSENRVGNVQKVRMLWKSVGSRVLDLAPELHDELVSRSSHLPHVLAAALSNYVLASHFPAEQARLCAGGFRDSTRIASGSPEMWRDICLTNSEQIANVLEEFIGQLKSFHTALASKDSAAIESFFTTAKTLRDQWLVQATTVTPE